MSPKQLIQRVITGAAIALFALPAAAELRIRIEGGATGALPIAVVPFANNSGGALPDDVTEVIRNDLLRSGLFSPIDESKMLSKPTEPGSVKLQNWRALRVDGQGVDNLLIGRVGVRPGGGYLIEFNLYDVFGGEELMRYRVPVPESRLRAGAHRVADLVFEKLTGVRGAFSTQIAYVTARGGVDDRRYGIVVADADGHGPIEVVSSTEPLLSPAWSPDGSQLAYVRFNDGNTAIVLLDLRTGGQRTLVSRPGVNGAPAWSPDGRSIVCALSFTGDAELYRVEVASGQLIRLTQSRAIETEPSWSPDGQRIVFTSDRAGKPQIYEIPATGGQARRLSFSGTSNSRPQYAPDGESITLVTNDEGGERIAVLDLETRETVTLSRGPSDESPSYAPNGAQIMYARRGGTLALVTVDGTARSVLSQAGTVRDPAWSPFPSR